MIRDDWQRRYEANQRVPYLPDGDDSVDYAVGQLREAVDEITGQLSVEAVVRVLRHSRGLAGEVLYKAEPTCINCGSARVCMGCDDTRPKAEQLAPGWRWVSPLGRWETVERVDQDNEYGPMRVWTAETGPDYAWVLRRYVKVDAVAPVHRPHGNPEIRIREYEYSRDAPMFAVLTWDTVYRPDNTDPIAEAHYSRETGWRVTHRPAGGVTATIDCGSKAQARTALKTAAREHAKALGVKVVIQPKSN